jgi:hypothetical protein
VLEIDLSEHIDSELAEVERLADSAKSLCEQARETIDAKSMSTGELHDVLVRLCVISDMMGSHVKNLDLVGRQLIPR